MPTPTFKRITVDQFVQMLAKFPFSRQIDAVHMHHTWKPDRRDFKGHDTIVSMWRFHTQQMKWRDIAQHITIDPEGFIWLGRNWNLPPASAAGYNGNERNGPFMFEMVGNFDQGADPFDGPQRDSALDVVAAVQKRFGLALESLKFHNSMSAKSCPGSSLDYADILAELKRRQAAPRKARAAPKDVSKQPFIDEIDHVIDEAIERLQHNLAEGIEPANAELQHNQQDHIEQSVPPPAPAATMVITRPESTVPQASRDVARSSDLSPQFLANLRPHLINLRSGRFSTEGEVSTAPGDVDALFDEHLTRALADAETRSEKLRVMFFAHGGLVSESKGLQIAARHVEWWKKNNVYPIYFIWETGFFETIGQLLVRSQQGATRGLARDFWDFTTDPLIELAARALQGVRLWGGMKSSAEHALDAETPIDPIGGGAFYVAQKLKQFCDRNHDRVELHAVGHSAGSIFHTHFLSRTHALGVPTFRSAHFLAPAIRVDTFVDHLGSELGPDGAAEKLTIFTMKKDFERADQCDEIYRKSLLYLIYYALEPERETPILGLEQSLRADSKLRALFGLEGAPSPIGEVIWSVTDTDSGASASTSTAHGDFDDDAPTMNSVMRRILSKQDADPIVEYSAAPAGSRGLRPWTEEVDWPEELNFARRNSAAAPPTVITPSLASSPSMVWPQPSTPIATRTSSSVSANGGRLLGLCVGIDQYPNPRHQLAGCVADARMWADALSRLGFSSKLLLDEQATRQAIAAELEALITQSTAGDVLVFQYSGHGTQLPDLNGDEDDQTDEALCPIDFASGAFFLDDDIAELFARLPAGVNLTCFTDCCHSATNTRFAVGLPTDARPSGHDERKRFVIADANMIAAHEQFRRRMGGASRALSSGGPDTMRDIKFSACLDAEVAWESDGHGEFTLRATRLLAAGVDGTSNEDFARRVSADFGANARQHVGLDCSAELRGLRLLAPRNTTGANNSGGSAVSVGATTTGGATAAIDQSNNAALLETLRALQNAILQLAKR